MSGSVTSSFMLPDAVVLHDYASTHHLATQGTSAKSLLLRSNNGIGNHVRMLRADGFVQDKRILACATMRGRKMPKALALTIRTRVLNRGLKGGVFVYKRLLFK